MKWLAKPVLVHWLLPYIMLLVVLGTVAQPSIGLFESQQRYFSSFILWIAGVPLPGGRLACAALLVSLLAKILVASPWSRAKAGIFVAHLGVLLLLLGGVVTTVLSSEGYVALAPNETASRFLDYHARVLTVEKNRAVVLSLPFETLTAQQVIANPALPFTVTVAARCSNCTMAMRQGAAEALHGPAQKVMLSPLPKDTDDERNLAGAELVIHGASDAADGTYVAFEPMRKQPEITVGADRYRLAVERASHPLPFTLQLLAAEKELHPGTMMPRSYRSTVLLTDGAVQQQAVISMNHPLRYKGVTVYQSSFSGTEETDAPVAMVSFAVVRNAGRVFPYVASVTICVGLVMHLALRLPGLVRRREGRDVV